MAHASQVTAHTLQPCDLYCVLMLPQYHVGESAPPVQCDALYLTAAPPTHVPCLGGLHLSQNRAWP